MAREFLPPPGVGRVGMYRAIRRHDPRLPRRKAWRYSRFAVADARRRILVKP